MSVVEVERGDGPVILGQPHGGLSVPEALRAELNETGLALADTDWHIGRLYDGLLPSATVVRATFHRYVIDANRDPAQVSLYPGQNTTGLCPLTDFDGRPLHRDGFAPDAAETARRLEEFHAPYHRALAAEIERVRARHGVAVLYDCHSIRSTIPFLFEGRLPLFNIGSNDGATCDGRLQDAVAGVCREAVAAETDWDTALNGRFKGGWTTRTYGRPADGVHAIQMELGQRGYMDESPPWSWRAERADRLRPWLGRILAALDELARSGALEPQQRRAER